MEEYEYDTPSDSDDEQCPHENVWNEVYKRIKVRNGEISVNIGENDDPSVLIFLSDIISQGVSGEFLNYQLQIEQQHNAIVWNPSKGNRIKDMRRLEQLCDESTEPRTSEVSGLEIPNANGIDFTFSNLKCVTIKTKLFHLPADMLGHIYEFDSFKYDGWNAVSSQFMKGGFIRKSLNIKIYLKREKWCARKFWTAKRLNLYPIKKEVYILKKEWDCKTKSALYEYAYTLDSGRISRRIVESGANPVSKWLKNIERFELTHPTLVSY